MIGKEWIIHCSSIILKFAADNERIILPEFQHVIRDQFIYQMNLDDTEVVNVISSKVVRNERISGSLRNEQ